MKSEDTDTATGTSDETEPNVGSEQQPESNSAFEAELLAQAKEDGHEIGIVPPKEEPTAEHEVETETPEEAPVEEEEPATEPEPDEEPEEEKPEELKPAAEKDTGDKLVPLREVLEERAKKKRANERAERAESEAEALRAQLSQAVAPQPTEEDPFRDIGDIRELDRLERSYEKAIDLADENPDGAEDVVIGYKDGKEVRGDLTAEQLALAKRKAEKAIRKFIPERRTYLQQRAAADAQATEIFPWLKDPDSEQTQTAAALAARLMSGEGLKSPDILYWIGCATEKHLEKRQANGRNKPVTKSPEAQKILDASKTKVAPTTTRTRALPQRVSGSDLAKAAQKLEERGDEDSALEYLNAVRLGQRGDRTKRVETVAD